MTTHTIAIHSLAEEMKVTVGYPAYVSVYQHGGLYHYFARIGVTDEPNGSKRAADWVHSHEIGQGFHTIWTAMAAGWTYIDEHWLGRRDERAEEQEPAEMVRDLLHSLGYTSDEFESPVQWQCRSCEAAVSPNGVVLHTEYCVVGKAERLLYDDPHYGPPAGDAGLEEFFAG